MTLNQGNPEAKLATQTSVVLPRNNMVVVMTGLSLTLFLASIDNTIVTTALPSIMADLGGTASGYSWIGVSYLLCSGAFMPLWGRLSDVIGRKLVLYPCIFVFIVGSGLCGAARSMNALIAFRALQGLGGGGTIVMVQIVLSDIVSLENRGKYGSALGACWGAACALGPVVGGILSQKASWRYCFWLNVPLGLLASALLLFLNLNPASKMSFTEFSNHFDFLGALLLVLGTGTFLAGLSLAADRGFGDPATIALIAAGPLLLVVAGLVEWRTPRMAIIPPRLLKTRTTLSLFGVNFLHGIGFMCTLFYLPVVFQGVNGDNSLISGLKMFPVSLGGALAMTVSGPLVTFTKRTRPIIWAGTLLMGLGAGLLILLSEKSSLAAEMLFSLVQGLGAGLLSHPLLIALQAAMPLKDMGACTGALYVVRTLGQTTGVALGGVTFQTELARRLRAIPELAGSSTEASILQGNYKDIKAIMPAELRDQVVVALSRSLRMIFIVLLPVAATAFLLSLLLRHYSLERNLMKDLENIHIVAELPRGDDTDTTEEK